MFWRKYNYLAARRGALVTAALLLTSLAGCRSVDEFEPVAVQGMPHQLSLHRILSGSEGGGLRTRILTAPDGRQIAVAAIPLLWQKNVCRITFADSRDARRLLAHLDRHGQVCWGQIRGEYATGELAIALDDFFAGVVKVPQGGQADTIVLHGNWHAAEAEEIVKQSIPVYNRLNARRE